MSGTKGMMHYPQEVKLEAVRMFLEDGNSYREIAEQLGIRKTYRIRMWVKGYRKEGKNTFTKPIGRPRKGPENEQSEMERLRMENALLKKLQSESRKDLLAKHDIGQSHSLGKSSK